MVFINIYIYVQLSLKILKISFLMMELICKCDIIIYKYLNASFKSWINVSERCHPIKIPSYPGRLNETQFSIMGVTLNCKINLHNDKWPSYYSFIMWFHSTRSCIGGEVIFLKYNLYLKLKQDTILLLESFKIVYYTKIHEKISQRRVALAAQLNDVEQVVQLLIR